MAPYGLSLHQFKQNTVKNERKHEMIWELIDAMFTKVEYWNEDPTCYEISEDERLYLKKVISSFAKKRNVMNHCEIIL